MRRTVYTQTAPKALKKEELDFLRQQGKGEKSSEKQKFLSRREGNRGPESGSDRKKLAVGATNRGRKKNEKKSFCCEKRGNIQENPLGYGSNPHMHEWAVQIACKGENEETKRTL